MNRLLTHLLLGTFITILRIDAQILQPWPEAAWRDNISVTIAPESSGCEIVKFPSSWEFPEPLYPEGPNISLRWRKTKDAIPTYIIAGEKDYRISTNKVKVRLGDRVVVEPGSNEEWEQAAAIRPSIYPSSGRPNIHLLLDGFKTGEHFHQKRGRHFAAGGPFLVSPDLRYFVMRSFDGPQHTEVVDWALRKGKVYVDIYDLKTGAERAAVTATYSYVEAHELFGGGWYPPGFLVIQFMARHQRSVIVCRFEKVEE